MYNGCLKKTGHAFRNSLSHVTGRIIPFHRRINFSFPEQIPINQKTVKRMHPPTPNIRNTNCKGHVQSSKAIRRHLGLPVSCAHSGRTAMELRTIEHGSIDDHTVNQHLKTYCVKKYFNINNYDYEQTGNPTSTKRRISLTFAKQTGSKVHTPTKLTRRKSLGDENFMVTKLYPVQNV